MSLWKGTLPAAGEDETIDYIGNGRFLVLQSKSGYRFSIDALLLGGFVRAKACQRVLEIGAGNGVALISLLSRSEVKDAVGLEIQPRLAALAERNLLLNGLQARAKIVCRDVTSYANEMRSKGDFDVIFFNPPYRCVRSGTSSPDMEKAIAKHEIRGSLDSFLRAARRVLVPKGEIFFIYPAAYLSKTIAVLQANKMVAAEMLFVHSRIDSPACLVLICASKSRHERSRVLPPFYIYAKTGSHYTLPAQRLFNDFCLFPTDGAE